MFVRIIFKVKENSKCRSEPFCGIKFIGFSSLAFDFIIAISTTQDLFFQAKVAKSLYNWGIRL